MHRVFSFSKGMHTWHTLTHYPPTHKNMSSFHTSSKLCEKYSGVLQNRMCSLFLSSFSLVWFRNLKLLHIAHSIAIAHTRLNTMYHKELLLQYIVHIFLVLRKEERKQKSSLTLSQLGSQERNAIPIEFFSMKK